MFNIREIFTTLTLLLLGAGLALPALAQKLSGMAVVPVSVREGAQVTVTLDFEVMSGTNCGMRLHWGDGRADDIKVNQRKDVPWIARHSYAKAGSYEVMAEPKTQGFVPRCGGDNQRATVLVTGAPLATSSAAPANSKPTAVPKATVAVAAPAAGACPSGWRLGANGIDAKTQGFTCIAAPNTKLPAQRLNCPGELSYYENAKKGELGCRR